MDEFRITVTAGRHGYTEADAEKLLDAALERRPDDGPVTALDSETGELTLVVSRAAPSARQAIEYGETLAHILFRDAELALRKFVALEVELADQVADEQLTAPA